MSFELLVEPVDYSHNSMSVWYSQDDTYPISQLSAEWQHWVVVYDSKTIKLYCDNEIKTEKQLDFNTSNGRVYLGKRLNLMHLLWDGAIDDVAIYNRALTDTEVETLYKIGGWPVP